MGYLQQLMGADEEVLFETRHHWTALVGRIWWPVVLLVVGLVLSVAGILFGGVYLDQAVLDPTARLILRAALVLFLLAIPIVTIVARVVRWRGEQFIITNYRVIHLQGIFAKSVIDSSLEKVNDVVLYQSLLGRMLDFGNLEILTSSDIGVNKLYRIGRPLMFKKAMLDAKQYLEGDAGQHRAAPAPAPDIPDLIARLAALRDQGSLSEVEFQAKKEILLKRI